MSVRKEKKIMSVCEYVKSWGRQMQMVVKIPGTCNDNVSRTHKHCALYIDHQQTLRGHVYSAIPSSARLASRAF